MTKTDPNTKENLQKQEKTSRHSPRCKKTRKAQKVKKISIPSQHDVCRRATMKACLLAKKAEEINIEKIFHRSTMHHNAARWSNLAPKLMKCT
ncbi:hypothetical protein QL285_014461 [Trifolium repens]|nr:hypothetical protein QL285_014461 [Trifolium repens]